MLDKYSQETKICNLLHEYLIKENYHTIQLISPGAQATFSISYTSEKNFKKKTIFPDVIALKDKTIIMGEVKPKFSKEDKQKLLNFKTSKDGKEQLVSLVKRVTKTSENDFCIKCLLIHGDARYNHDNEISQLFLSGDAALLIE